MLSLTSGVEGLDLVGDSTGEPELGVDPKTWMLRLLLALARRTEPVPIKDVESL